MLPLVCTFPLDHEEKLNIVNGALLLIAGNESCPQPQTGEHLAALEIIGVDPKNIVILQNKMDLVRESEAVEHCESIKKFVEGE